MCEMKFIVTMDDRTADNLRSSGYVLLYENDGTYTFLNDLNLRVQFSDLEKTKFFYTNMLCV